MGKDPEVVNKLDTPVLCGARDKLIRYSSISLFSAIPNLEIDAWKSDEIERNKLSEYRQTTDDFIYLFCSSFFLRFSYATEDNGLIG